MAKLLGWVLQKQILSKVKYVSNLKTTCFSPRNRNLLRGKMQTLRVSFDEILLEDFQISGGGSFEIRDLSIRLKSLIGQRSAMLQESFSAYLKCFLTNDDVLKCPSIIEFTELLVNKFLKRRLPPKLSFSGAKIKSVQLQGKQFLVQGTLTSLSPSFKFGIPFTLMSGVQLSANGHVLEIVNLSLNVNYGNVKVSIPIPTENGGKIYGIDLGDNAQLEDFEITESGIGAKMRIVLSPNPKQPVSEGKPVLKGMPTDRALFSYDLGYIVSSEMSKVLEGGSPSNEIVKKTSFFDFKPVWFFSGLWEMMVFWICKFHLED